MLFQHLKIECRTQRRSEMEILEMGMSSGGVGGSTGAGGSGSPGGSSNNDNDRGGASGSNGDSNDVGRADTKTTDQAESKSDSSQRGMTGADRGFGNALNDAADKQDDGRPSATNTDDMIDSAGRTFGGLSNPSNTDDDRSADDAAQAAARASHPANEFSGLGPSDGPIDNGLPGPQSLNSHRGYGPDETMAGGIDVQGRLDELDQQIAEQKAKEGAHVSLFDTRDTPNVNTPENPTGLNSVPEATSVVNSGDTNHPSAYAPDKRGHDFATDASAGAAIIDGLSTIGAGYPEHLAPEAVDTLKSASRIAKAVGPAAETLEATLNAEPGDRARSGVEGFLSSIDDLAVGLGSGGAVTAITGNPPAGAMAGTGAAIAYDNSPPDKAFDEGVRAAGDMIEDGIETAKKGVSDFERSLMERALNEIKRQAGNR